MAIIRTKTHTRHPLMASSAKYLAPVQSAEKSAHCGKLSASDKSTGYAKCEPESHLNKVMVSRIINVLPQSAKSHSGSNPLKTHHSYNRSAAQGGKSHLAEILTYKTFVGAHAENNSGQKCLPVVGVRGYGNSAPVKSGVGSANPVFVRAHNRAYAVFLCAMHGYTQSMVGRAGEPQGSPGSLATGFCSPARLTTLEPANSGGELTNLSQEAAAMAISAHMNLTSPEVSHA